MNTPQLIGILAFLAFGASIAAFFKKTGMWLQRSVGLGQTMTIRCKSGKTIEVKNVSITLHTDSMRMILEATRKGLIPKKTLPEDELKRKSSEFVKNADNTSRATYAINTFRAYASGFMKDLLGIDDDISINDFDEIVSFLYNTNKQDGIPNLGEQLNAVFSECPPSEGEFVIGWADRIVVTNHRMILTSEGKPPTIEHEINLNDVEHYSV